MTIDYKRRLIITQNTTLQINSVQNAEEHDEGQPETRQGLAFPLTTMNAITIPPNRQEIIYCQLAEDALKYKHVTGIVEPPPLVPDTESTAKHAIAHAIVTLDQHGGCQVIITNLSHEKRRFPKDLHIAQFSNLSPEEGEQMQETHPIAAECILAAAEHIEVTRDEFKDITWLACMDNPLSCSSLDTLDENVQRANQDFYQKPDNPATYQEVHHSPLEGNTNEMWFATPENTTNPDQLDPFNRRV